MPLIVAEWIVYSAAAYAVLGGAFAAAFVARGVARVDPHAANAGLAFRLILLPGAAAFWPLLLRRWIAGGPVPIERTVHRERANGAPLR